ncbi:MAG TPA: glycoside hydrolase family 97 N-terminal domain-containing protein [Draconibacterium sp.]|nr:glycoside hydrolase family 97 N-terminal domain-containing protein [Draconibacterium sp.]
MKNLILLLIATSLFSCSKSIQIKSPDGKITVTVGTGDSSVVLYSFTIDDSIIVQNSRMGFILKGGQEVGKNLEIISFSEMEVNQSWKPVYGERSEIKDHFNEAKIQLKEKSSPGKEFEITFRVYNEGVAFNYTFPAQSENETLQIQKELTEFRLTQNFECWASERAQSEIRKIQVNSIEKPVERPLVVEAGNWLLAVGEAKLVDFARMKFMAGENENSLMASLEGEAVVKLPYTTPWRTIMIGKSAGELLENNYFYENLNDPCAIEDVSWIKPGKVIREVTLTTQGGLACVDFAAENGIQYVEFDAGWYGAEGDENSDATTVTVDSNRSPGPLDLHRVIEYAETKGIGIILYVNRRALEKQIDEILPLYKSWGIKGVKYGFVQVGSQEWTTWLHDAVKKAAENKLMVDIHDEYRPTGFSRTYPNLLTQEGIRGDEESPSNEHTLITLFTRMLAGAADNTNCYYSPRVTEKMGGHVSQLAKAVMIYSPWQFLFWYDRPDGSPGKKGGAGDSDGFIKNHPELDFFKNMPTVWDETKVLESEIGKFATIVRGSGNDWFLGSLTGSESRTCNIDFKFLDSGADYSTTVYSFNPNSESSTKVYIEQIQVKASILLNFNINANSGLAMHIQKN